MDLSFDADDLAFQREVREWLEANYDVPLRRQMALSKNGYLDKEGQVRWQKLLANGLAEELASRRNALRPELENRLAHLENCLRKLPKDQRGIIEGYYYRRENIEALASDAGRTIDASYKMLQRIRQALQHCIENAARQEEAAV